LRLLRHWAPADHQSPLQFVQLCGSFFFLLLVYVYLFNLLPRNRCEQSWHHSLIGSSSSYIFRSVRI
jgi:hypothetical protein